MTVQWVSADLLTQTVIADLPGIDLGSNMLTRTISTAETSTLTLNLDEDTPENWQSATLPLAAVLACYDDVDATQAIMWGGVVTSRVLDATTNQVPLSATTGEGMLDRAYVGDTTYDTTWHRDDIIADLITTWFTPKTGIALALQYTPGAGPTPTDPIVMQNTDNATVKGRIDQVVAQLGGEYTIEWAWADSNQKLAPTLVFGDHIGPGVSFASPAVTFEMPGLLSAFTQTLDYSLGAGANKVIAYSSGQGATAPDTVALTVPPGPRPVLEYRYSPAPSVSPAALAQYAAQAIAVLGPGAQPITMTYQTDQSTGRRLGVDWFLGDTIGYRIAGQYTNEQGITVTIFSFPNGTEGIGRVISIVVDPTNSLVTPVMADPTVYVAED